MNDARMTVTKWRNHWNVHGRVGYWREYTLESQFGTCYHDIRDFVSFDQIVWC